ncbi:molybdopterin converting factor subunit 1 [Rhizosaccharibacter radicis]|uniref:Molybdopterin synthase sulfur carrier subunit n=1 Tax=Rhizosaccharibacter radicis TaxID=2782605 RepID=A0ABT1VXW1_9PROT|nr:molybdopterin converting factor subunit 1 [Acetobacteraceae bacterium KSS12]
MGSVHLLYFAWLREQLGRSEERLDLPPEVDRVDRLLRWLRQRDPALDSLAGSGRAIRVAVNQRFARDGDPVRAGDEVALFPPVTGG